MRQEIASHTTGQINLKDAISGGDTSGFQNKVQDWYDGLPPAQRLVVQHLVSGIDGSANPVIHYELEKSVSHPWNALVGMELGLTPAWRLRGEVGFIDRTQVIVGFNYRFGSGSEPVTPKP
jgi:hypothetical protein